MSGIGKIMAASSLDDIMIRLTCCCASLDAVHRAMDDSNNMQDALYGTTDQLRSICRDFQADIDAAEDYTGKGAAV